MSWLPCLRLFDIEFSGIIHDISVAIGNLLEIIDKMSDNDIYQIRFFIGTDRYIPPYKLTIGYMLVPTSYFIQFIQHYILVIKWKISESI